MKKIAAILTLAISVFSAFAISSEIEILETPEEQQKILKKAARKKVETPVWVKDIRRAEIITFGSLPFTMLGVNLVTASIDWGKSGFASGAFPNPINPSPDTENFSESEIWRRVGIAASISIGIGVTDLVVHIIKGARERRKKTEVLRINNITVTPIIHDAPRETADKTAEATQAEK